MHKVCARSTRQLRRSARLHLVALVVLPTTRLSERACGDMVLNMDWSDFPHLSQHHRELAEHMAQGLGEQALVNLLHCPPEQHVAQLEQFEAFVLGHRRNASEVNSQATAESITKTQDELRLEQARNEALNRSVRRSLPGLLNRGPFGWTLRSSMELALTRLLTGY